MAHAFFAGDSGEASFDALAGTGNSDRIELDDVIALNRTARARSPHRAWAPLIAVEAPWLASLGPDLDLLELGEKRWKAVDGDALVAAALRATIGPGRGMAVATKLLHLKRPRLFPMLDRFVAEMLGASVPDAGANETRVATAVALTQATRREGRRNLAALRVIQEQLADDGIHCSLVRIFDAIVWSSHPAAGISAGPRVLSAQMRRATS